MKKETAQRLQMMQTFGATCACINEATTEQMVSNGSLVIIEGTTNHNKSVDKVNRYYVIKGTDDVFISVNRINGYDVGTVVDKDLAVQLSKHHYRLDSTKSYEKNIRYRVRTGKNTNIEKIACSLRTGADMVVNSDTETHHKSFSFDNRTDSLCRVSSSEHRALHKAEKVKSKKTCQHRIERLVDTEADFNAFVNLISEEVS